jgi:hypothetical protein
VRKKIRYWFGRENGVSEYWNVGVMVGPIFHHSKFRQSCFVPYATLEILAFASAENPRSNHHRAISLPVANHTPLCDFM